MTNTDLWKLIDPRDDESSLQRVKGINVRRVESRAEGDATIRARGVAWLLLLSLVQFGVLGVATGSIQGGCFSDSHRASSKDQRFSTQVPSIYFCLYISFFSTCFCASYLRDPSLKTFSLSLSDSQSHLLVSRSLWYHMPVVNFNSELNFYKSLLISMVLMVQINEIY